MANDCYFKKFPLVNYNGQPVVDITRRAVITTNQLNNPFLFYPVSVNAGQRTDQVAQQYFDDPYREWLLFLSNQITDPYDSWYMSGLEFDAFITKKYGNTQIAQQKIMNYTNNWYNDPGISIDAYDALPIEALKFYQANYDQNGNVINYSRVQEDWTLNTNYLVSYQFTNPTISGQFIDDEICSIHFNANTIGSGQFTFSTNSVINLQHVNGYFINPPNTSVNAASFIITGSESNATITTSSANNLTITVYNSAPADVYVYYDPVYYYDYETNKNEANKNINIMISGFVDATSTTLTKVLNQ